MYGLLKPTTLAAVVADLEEAVENGWAKLREHDQLEDAKAALVALVGEDQAEKMIENAGADRLREAAAAVLDKWLEHTGEADDWTGTAPEFEALAAALDAGN